MSGPPPVSITFAVKNLNETLQAIKSIQDAVTRSERQSVAAAKASKSARQKVLEEEVRQKIAMWKQLDRLANKGWNSSQEQSAKRQRASIEGEARRKIATLKQLDREADRAFNASLKKQHSDEASARKQSLKRHEEFEKQKSRLARGLAVERHKAQLDAQRGGATNQARLSAVARMAHIDSAKGKSLAEQQDILNKAKLARQEAQIDRQKRKQAESEEKKKQKAISAEVEREEKRRQAIRERSASYAGRFAIQQAEKERKAREAALKADEQRRDQLGGVVRTGLAKGAGAIAGIAGKAFNTIMNVGGGFSVEDSLQREVQFKGMASSIANKTQTGLTQGEIESKARATAIQHGIDPTEVLKGYDQVTKLNDAALPQALRVMPDIAKIATVTGTDMGDMGGLAAAITAAADQEGRTYTDASGRTQKGISDADLKRQLRVFARQGVEGGVEISDFAKFGSRITAGAGLFTNLNAQGQYDPTMIEQHEATLGMAAQVARQKGGAASASEATLAAQRMATDIQKKAGHLKSLGIDVNSKDGKLRDMGDIIGEMLDKESSVTGISEFKIGERGNRVLTGFADIYRTAEAQKKGSGREAVRRTFAAGKKDISEKDVNERFDNRMKEVDKQLEVAMTKLRIEVGTKLLPKFKELIPVLTRLIPWIGKALDAFVRIADWAASNPIKAAVAVLGGSIVREVMTQIVSAKIGDLIKSLISGGGGSKPGTGGGSGGSGGVIGAAVGTGVAAGAVIGNALINYDDGAERARNLSAKLEAWQRGDKQGGMSPEQVQKEMDSARGRLKEHGGVLEQTANLLTSPFVEGSDRDYKKYKADQGLTESPEALRLQKQLIEALDKNTKATQAGALAMNDGGGKGSQGDPNRSQPIPKRANPPGR